LVDLRRLVALGPQEGGKLAVYLGAEVVIERMHLLIFREPAYDPSPGSAGGVPHVSGIPLSSARSSARPRVSA
jgi:hypothetical protein